MTRTRLLGVAVTAALAWTPAAAQDMIDKPIAKPRKTNEWKLEAGDGTLAPRSALDVLTGLNERVASGSMGCPSARRP